MKSTRRISHSAAERRGRLPRGRRARRQQHPPSPCAAGSATAYGDGAQVPIAAGQQVRFAGTNLQALADNGAPGADAFRPMGREAASAAEDRSVSARYVSREIPGYQDLDANGTWRSSPQYGEVWVPRATPAGWAP